MKLDVKERILLLSILPKEGTLATFRILTELKSALSFNEKEYKEFKIEEKSGMINWKNSKEKDILIGETANTIIVDLLKKIDEAGKVTEDNYSLLDKFIK